MQVPGRSEQDEQRREDSIWRKRKREEREQSPEEEEECASKRRKLEEQREQNPDKREESCSKKSEQEEETEQHNPEEQEECAPPNKSKQEKATEEWLQCLLETRFYDKCEKHASTRCNFFCKDCKGNALCKYESDQHIGHQLIQVYKASDHPGVRVKAIKELVDISDIQLYSINSFGIVYITPRRRKGNDNGELLHGPTATTTSPKVLAWKKCYTCGRELVLQKPPHTNYKFCSIKCKVQAKTNEGTGVANEEGRDVGHDDNDHGSIEALKHEQISYRKRRRKGFPIRAPFH